MALPAINYQALELERTSEIQDELSKKLAKQKDFGSRDTIRNSVLTHVVGSDYEAAIQELDMYVEFKSDYPLFRKRVQRYVDHCKDLIHAISTKRNFPGLGALSLSKQQELYERVLAHFEELKSSLKQIEQVERDIKLTDVRSTVGFIKSSLYACMFVLVVGFCLEVVNGLAESFNSVVNNMTNSLTNFIFSLFG